MGSERFLCEGKARSILTVGGEDRHSFLQALISNDVAALAAGQACWAALLTPQGKYLCDFFVVATSDHLLIDVEEARADDLLQRLKRYRLRAKVTLDRLPDRAVLLGWGGGALDAFGLGTTGNGAVLGNILIFADPRLQNMGIRIIGEASESRALLDSHGFIAASFAAWDESRLRLGVPDGTRDLIPEQSILLEAGFDELHGVSWTKGCYIGQELTARTKYRALIRKRLLPVQIEGPAPALGSIVLQDGKEAGEMRSSQDGFGLALLRLEMLDAGPLECAGAVLRPAIPDWLKRTEAAP